MKTPGEIKRGLECCGTTWEGPNSCIKCPYSDGRIKCGNEMHDDALAYIQQLEAQAPKWISVEERLPEVSDVVLVVANGKPRENITLDNALLIASFWGEEGWIADGFEGWDALKVTHWMPLPEPPKEG